MDEMSHHLVRSDEYRPLEIRGEFKRAAMAPVSANLIASIKVAAAPGALKMLYHTTVRSTPIIYRYVVCEYGKYLLVSSPIKVKFDS